MRGESYVPARPGASRVRTEVQVGIGMEVFIPSRDLDDVVLYSFFFVI